MNDRQRYVRVRGGGEGRVAGSGYFASKARAMIPDARAAEAEVPVRSEVQVWCRFVVTILRW